MEKKYEIETIVNKKPVELNNFVQRLITNVVLGIIKSLRLPEEKIEKIEITLTRKD